MAAHLPAFAAVLVAACWLVASSAGVTAAETTAGTKSRKLAQNANANSNPGVAAAECASSRNSVGPGGSCDPECGNIQCTNGNTCAPSRGGSLNGQCCFPGDAAVTALLPNGRIVTRRMDQLQIGDKVLTQDSADGCATFEPIYVFGHQDSGAVATFVQLHTQDSSAPLELTPDHFVPVADPATGGSIMHRAGAVRAGQSIWLATSGGAFKMQPVLQVANVTKDGLFNPYTLGGNIVVNGALASSHSSWFLDGVAPQWMVRHLPSIYQVALAPARWLYHAIGDEGARRLDARLNFAAAAGSGKGVAEYMRVTAAAVAASMTTAS